MSGASVGRIYLKNGKWYVTLSPHAAIWFKRIFPRVPGEKVGTYELLNSPRVCADLQWFLQRFTVDVTPIEVMKRGAAAYDLEQRNLFLIQQDDYKPTARSLALPLRHYQGVAVDLHLHRRSLLLGDDVGLGKQQPIDSLVLTPTGWRMLRDVLPGEFVIGSNGRRTKITGKFPQGVKPSYRVKFSDGSSVEAGPEHLWRVAYWCGGRRLTELTVTTEQIRTGATVGTLCLGKTRLMIPMLANPVEFDARQPLPIAPYLLGILIANGSLAHNGTSVSMNTLDWPEVRKFLDGEHIGAVQVYGGTTRAGIPGIVQEIKTLGLNVLSPEKRIPLVYLRASAKDRIALLHGLMDADGSISAERNRVTYHTTSPGLAKDVEELVECLGGIATVRDYDRTDEGKPIEYQVRIRLPANIAPFRVARKARRYKVSTRTLPKRSIVGVDYVRDVESVCIAVEAADHLYATEHVILTHNTAVAIGGFADPGTLPACVVTYAHLQTQWKREIERFLPGSVVHIVKTRNPYDLTTRAGKLPDVVIITYSKLPSWDGQLGSRCKSIVFDEAQELRRNESDKYRAAKKIAEAMKYRLMMTATPIYNHGGEIFNIMDCLKPDCLGSAEEFHTEWCKYGGNERSDWVLSDPAALGTYLRAEGLMLRRTRRDVGRELPAISKVTQVVDADETLLSRIQGPAAELARIILKQNKTKLSGLDQMQAASEFTNLLRQQTGIAKAPSVAAFVRILVEEGERVVLGGWHHAVYNIWREALADLKPEFFTGQESPAQKQRARDRFCNRDTNLLVLSLRSGVGLDGLQGHCRTVVIGELDWSPAVHKQFIGRVHRDGQAEPTFAYFLVANSGCDPIMVQTLGLKDEQATGVVDPTTGNEPELLDGVAKDRIEQMARDYLARMAG